MSKPAFCVEALETRTLFAGASVIGDVLRVTANPAATNTVVITETAAGVDVDITSVTRRGVAKHFEASFPKALGFTRVHVRGGMGDDTINFAGVNPATAFSMQARVNGRAGNDAITTGSGDDLVTGGLGDDVIRTGDGNDIVHANGGNDTVFGENGDDVLWGGLGDDRVEGGAGSDKLGGILGTNALIGGEDSDEFVVRSIETNPDNDFTDAVDILTIVTKRGADAAAGPAI